MVKLQRSGSRRGYAWLSTYYAKACRVSPGFRKLSRRIMYQVTARLIPHREWRFMNYGFASLASDCDSLVLDAVDEADRYCIQLYDHVAGAVYLQGTEALEVGSGRGGGSYFVNRYLGAAQVVGLDYSEHAVSLCRQAYDLPGLRFVHGDAEDLPFDDVSFDALVNVESSHCYGSMSRFLAEVVRVLRPGGHFLFADFRRNKDLQLLDRQFDESGLRTLVRQDITPNVVAAIEMDNVRKLRQIQRAVPRWLSGLMAEFAGAPGSRIYDDFTSGATNYVSYVLRKAAL